MDSLHLKPHPPTVLLVDGVEWWVFSTADYENLASNHQDYLRALRQQRAVIDYYRDCLDSKPTEATRD